MSEEFDSNMSKSGIQRKGSVVDAIQVLMAPHTVLDDQEEINND